MFELLSKAKDIWERLKTAFKERGEDITMLGIGLGKLIFDLVYYLGDVFFPVLRNLKFINKLKNTKLVGSIKNISTKFRLKSKTLIRKLNLHKLTPSKINEYGKKYKLLKAKVNELEDKYLRYIKSGDLKSAYITGLRMNKLDNIANNLNIYNKIYNIYNYTNTLYEDVNEKLDKIYDMYKNLNSFIRQYVPSPREIGRFIGTILGDYLFLIEPPLMRIFYTIMWALTGDESYKAKIEEYDIRKQPDGLIVSQPKIVSPQLAKWKPVDVKLSPKPKTLPNELMESTTTEEDKESVDVKLSPKSETLPKLKEPTTTKIEDKSKLNEKLKEAKRIIESNESISQKLKELDLKYKLDTESQQLYESIINSYLLSKQAIETSIKAITNTNRNTKNNLIISGGEKRESKKLKIDDGGSE
jgi:tetrahydromethanopterin S-methyltransferase subunit G